MTTDTAARVTRMVVQDKCEHLTAVFMNKWCEVALRAPIGPLDKVSYIDRPDIEITPKTSDEEGPSPSETVSMPFRYVKGADEKPVMPKVC
jgi:hypothetical protein